MSINIKSVHKYKKVLDKTLTGGDSQGSFSRCQGSHHGWADICLKQKGNRGPFPGNSKAKRWG